MRDCLSDALDHGYGIGHEMDLIREIAAAIAHPACLELLLSHHVHTMSTTWHARQSKARPCASYSCMRNVMMRR
jgi:hypothetical protein